MRKSTLLIIALVFSVTLMAQEKMYIHKTDNTTNEIPVSEVDSMLFTNSETTLNILHTDNTVTDYLIADIDSITFGADAPTTDTIKITYSGSAVTIDNPYAYYGVSITKSGSDVVINSSVSDVELKYLISGTTTDGSLKLYSGYKYYMILNGVNITNNDGPAINIQSGKKATIVLADGTTSYLTDGTTYTANETEDQKGTFFSEGQLNFEGSGTLSVKGNYGHAIASDDYIRLKTGNIIVTGAVKDGIHSKDYFRMDGGSLNITATSDGVECDEGYVQINDGNITINSGGDGIVASYNDGDATIVSTVVINGGTIGITTNDKKGAGIKSKASSVTINAGSINVNVKGIASKALSSGGDMFIVNGNITLTTSGGAYYDTDDLDVSSAAGIKCDGNLKIDNGTLTITSSGAGGKGISADGTLVVNNGTIAVTTTGDRYVYNSSNDTAAKAIKSDGNLTVNGGSITISTSKTEAEGLESKDSLFINGGTIEIVAYDDGINATNHIQINGGTIYVYSQTNDGIDSNGTLTITGGTVISSGSTSPEEGFDCDQNTFKITGGLLIGTGGATSTPTANVCTQRSLIYGAGSVTSGQYVQIKSSTGDILVYKLPRTYNSMTMLFSSPDMASGTTYTISKGGSVTGGTDFHGLYTGATYSGGTTAYTFNPTSMVTTVGSTGGGGGGRP
ncbi:MAG: carbohydrate-binding domain-containing protein [Dysgonomonas sp.]